MHPNDNHEIKALEIWPETEFAYFCICLYIYTTMNKQERHELIRNTIRNQKVGTQEDLVKILENQGVELTQATLSRDLKQLRAARVADPVRGLVYVLADEFVKQQTQEISTTGFHSIVFSGNLAIIKTLPAYSHTLADTIDKAAIPEILGTIAGNDTILLVLTENTSSEEVKKALAVFIHELRQ